MQPHPSSGSRRVAVIGGGWAGCAAAVHLARAGAAVTVYEQSMQLGGRARSVTSDGLVLDNGAHLLIGAYRATLELIAFLHGGRSRAQLFHELPLTVRPFGRPRGITLVATGSRYAPWHLVGGMLSAQGVGWAERWSMVRLLRALARQDVRHTDGSVEERFGPDSSTLYNELWAPLCLAALNTPPGRASSRVFRNVLRAALCGPASDSRFWVPKAGLSALLPEPAERFVTERRGMVQRGTRVRSIETSDDAVHVTTSTQRNTSTQRDGFDAAIIAVAPHQLAKLDVAPACASWEHTRRAVRSLSYESINTVHLGYTRAPMQAVIERLDDTPAQWLFNGGAREIAGESLQLLSAVISANGPHDALPQRELALAVDAQLRRLSVDVGALRFSRVFAERRATYACTPHMQRPRAGRVAHRLHLAGDYTHPDLPATLEAAVQSGREAGASALDELAALRVRAIPASRP